MSTPLARRCRMCCRDSSAWVHIDIDETNAAFICKRCIALVVRLVRTRPELAKHGRAA